MQGSLIELEIPTGGVMRIGYTGPEWAWLKARRFGPFSHSGLDPESREFGFSWTPAFAGVTAFIWFYFFCPLWGSS